MKSNQICKRCIYDSNVSGIYFDNQGICNYCKQVDSLQEQFGTGKKKGIRAFEIIIEEIKNSGKGKKYDCVIGVSGGTDSSYLLIKAVEWGLRPLAVHYDNTWNSAIATMNIGKVTSSINVDLYTYVVNNKEIDDIKKAFLYATVPEFDADTDIGYIQVLRSAAAKYGVKYILEGHSFIEEGVSPIGSNYFDGGYIASIHRKYGKLKMNSYPNMTFYQFLKWTIIYRQKFIRPFWYLNYSKEKARKELINKTGWIYYGGHHLENRATSFLVLSWQKKFGIDSRNLSIAAKVRNGQMSRESALEEYSSPAAEDENLIYYLKKRLNISDSEYIRIYSKPNKSFKDYKTYKKKFEMLRPLFFILAKKNIVPKSFYLKYCFPINDE